MMPRPVPKLLWFDEVLREIGTTVGLPAATPFRGEEAFLYKDKTVEQATLLKLVRYVSGLNAGQLLLSSGYLQELASLQRTLDEIHEDILFLSLPCFTGARTEHHDKYLEAFWEEEPDYHTFSGHQKNRHQVPRKNIRKYLSDPADTGTVDHSAIATSAFLSRMYSGYVHAAAPQLLELYDPKKGNFRTAGYPESPNFSDHASDFENQFFRGIVSVFTVARVVGAEEAAKTAFELHGTLEHYFHD